MADLVPVLLEKIKADFAESIAKDSTIQSVLERASNGTATHIDTQEYALRVGEASSSALRRNLTEEILPDGTLYYNIADRTVRPTIEQSHAIVNETAGQIQKTLNEQAGLGLNPVLPELDRDRLGRLIDKLSSGASFEDIAWLLDEPIVNLVQSFADDFVRENAKFQAKAGLSPKIRRTVIGNCCDYCAALAGVYNYPENTPEDVFRRHRFCRCLVTYDPADGLGQVQNVHKQSQWLDADTVEDLEIRKTIGLDLTRLTPQKAAILQRLLGDKLSNA